MAHWSDVHDPDGPDGAYLPWKKVEPRVGISRTTAWRLQKSGDFPKPYVISPGRVAYRESEVEAWKASRGHRSAGTMARRAALTAPRDSAPSAAPEPTSAPLPAPACFAPDPPAASARGAKAPCNARTAGLALPRSRGRRAWAATKVRIRRVGL
jgi:predicted DNA-binding transcriptional regulator AlpA